MFGWRAILWQLVVLAAVGAVAWVLVDNTLMNLQRRHVATGFAFLGRITGVPLASPVLEYDPSSSTYARAFLIGIINTLRLWVVAALVATVLGVFVGLARLSPNWLVRTAASVYVGAIRNVPCLLQILFWVALIERVGPPDEALTPFPGVFISNRGVALPWVYAQDGFGWTVLALAVGVIVLLSAWLAARRRSIFGAGPNKMLVAVALLELIVVPVGVFALTGFPATVELPQPGLFDFTGGMAVSSEFAALAIGLAIYASGYMAEIIRAGVLAVPRGQWDAAESINLGRATTLRWVVLPQALRLILPPMTSQYLSILKNSSLAIVIGYQDIVAVANLSLTQTGQAVEAVILIMVVYLVISAPLMLLMNWYNARLSATDPA
jgi:general L-amino acid transport system permease protein